MPSPFHPDLRHIAPFLPRGAFGPRTYRVVRGLERLAPRRLPANVQIASVGPISIRLHHPPTTTLAPYPALLWVHGGGYVIGRAAQDDALGRVVAERLGVLVAAVDYRRAPEHRFPVPLDDCCDALTWLAARDDVDEHHVAIGGASAGGGLAAALALVARDRGEIQPVLQLLSYPMLDDRTVLRHDVDGRHFRLWSSKANRFGWESYLGTAPGSAGLSALAAPARCEDLAGLAPAWIGVGSLDLFHDEDLAYAARLRTAGVECDVEIIDGAFHGFDSVAPRAPVTQQFRAVQLHALAARLHR
jgi:acetyl esterase/lipase